MDKYEYQVCTEQIKELIAAKRFAEAMEIADTIDWRRVRSVSMLVTVSEIYKVNKRYEDAKDILLLAYERHPNGRDIVYALCELFIKLGDVVQAIESYKEFKAIAPDDASSCILMYKIYKAQDVSLEEQIDVLEEYKRLDYREKWAYELASLYHKTGQEAKCVAECDELILWFGEGKYVRKAMELKMQHTSLSKDQQAKFDGRAITGTIPTTGNTTEDMLAGQFGNNAQQTGPLIDKYGEYLQQTGAMGVTGAINALPQPGVNAQAGQQAGLNAQADAGQPVNQNAQNAYAPQYDMYGNVINNGQYNQYGQYSQYDGGMQITPGMYQDASSPMQVTPDIHLGMTQDIMGQAFGTGVWSAAELQNQLGSEVREAMGYYPADNTYNTGNVAYGANTGNIQYGTDTGNITYTGATGSMSYAESPEPDVYAQIPSEDDKLSGIRVEPVIPEISVNTGVIDISEADLSLLNNTLPGEKLPEDELSVDSLPGDSLPDDELSGADLPGGPLTDDDDFTDDTPVEINSSTDDIMSALDGIIPGTGVKSIAQTGVSSSVNVHKTVSRITGQIPSFLPSAADVKGGGSDDEAADDTADKYSVSDDNISEDKEEDYSYNIKEETREEEISRISAVSKKAFPGYETPEVNKAEKNAATVQPDKTASETATEADGDVSEDNKAEAVSPFEDDSELPVTIEKRITAELPPVPEKLTPVGDEEGRYPYDTVADIGFVEELTEIEQPEDVDDILKTGKIPSSEIEKALQYETDSVEEIDEYDIEDVDDEDDDNSQMPAFMRKDMHPRREFDDAEYRIFCLYDGMKNLKAQLVDTLDAMSMEPSGGNIVIMAPESVDGKGIAINLVKAMQAKNPSFSGKVAKISGEALNKKNIKGTLDKLENGALVVERAGGLTQESVMLISDTLSDSDKPILVIFEGDRESIRPLFRYSKQMKQVFDARMDIADFTDDDLVSYGRGYALEQEYSIDEMGELALHNRISEMQTFDHKVTTDDVKDFIDMAIKNVDRKNMGHLMDMLLGRRYDDEDNIILSEKDFMF